MEFEFVTTQTKVDTYKATTGIFAGLIREVRELSKKKPDATLSKGKVKIINRVLEDLATVFEAEPEAKFLDHVDDDELPQTSDAVLIMVQYETALTAFPKRYQRRVDLYGGSHYWITEDFVAEYKVDYAAEYDEGEEGEEGE